MPTARGHGQINSFYVCVLDIHNGPNLDQELSTTWVGEEDEGVVSSQSTVHKST